MSAIEIKGLSVEACHGVLPEEKTVAQPFVFDINIDYDISDAAKTDDVADAVNYADVCQAVYTYCKENSFNLIERLASGAAKLIVNNFKSVSRVGVTVHKPRAPIGLPFDDVSVTAVAERNAVVLSLGSSMGDRQATLSGALASLGNTGGIEVKRVSDFIETQPYGGVAKNTFLNCAALIECTLSPQELLKAIHGIEAEFARTRNVRWDDRTLDIDIIFFGNRIIEEEGLCVPHPDYKNRDFVIVPLKQIVPDFVCPVNHKRISDL